MRVIKNVFRSRITWFIIGILVGVLVIPHIPAGSVGNVLKFIWSQKWGVLIGVGVIILISKIKKGFGFKIVRTNHYDEEPRR